MALVLMSLFIVVSFPLQTRALTCREVFQEPRQSQTLINLMDYIVKNDFYEPGGCCNQNIHTLVDFMTAAKMDLNLAKVIYIIPTRGNDPMLMPQRATSDVEIWDFHVVLLYKGKIYDFDFNGPILTPDLYLRDMFDITPRNDDGVVVRSIPAKDYLDDHIDHRLNTDLYNSGDPIVDTFRDYYWYTESGPEIYPFVPAFRQFPSQR